MFTLLLLPAALAADASEKIINGELSVVSYYENDSCPAVSF